MLVFGEVKSSEDELIFELLLVLGGELLNCGFDVSIGILIFGIDEQDYSWLTLFFVNFTDKSTSNNLSQHSFIFLLARNRLTFILRI